MCILVHMQIYVCVAPPGAWRMEGHCGCFLSITNTYIHACINNNSCTLTVHPGSSLIPPQPDQSLGTKSALARVHWNVTQLLIIGSEFPSWPLTILERCRSSWGEPERGRADIGTQAGMHNTWMCGQMRLLATCLALSRVPILVCT